MKNVLILLSVFAVFLVVGNAAALDQTTISDNVNDIVAKLESGQPATEIKAGAYSPYAFIMEATGVMLVHPSLAGENLMEKSPQIYAALKRANAEGVWVAYEWEGKTKHTYVKKTKDNLIVGSGY